MIVSNQKQKVNLKERLVAKSLEQMFMNPIQERVNCPQSNFNRSNKLNLNRGDTGHSLPEPLRKLMRESGQLRLLLPGIQE